MSDQENRLPNGRFKPGQSGNRSGVRKNQTHQDQVDQALAQAPEPEQEQASPQTISAGSWWPHRDGWASAITGIGDVTRDKRLSHGFSRCRLTYRQIAEMWETDGIAAKAVEAHTDEIFRAGYELDISDEGEYDDLKEQVVDKLRDLGVNKRLTKAYQYKRAYGGGALLLGTDDNQKFEEPLNLDSVQSLDWINVLEPIELYPVSTYDDPFHPKYGEPEYFQIDPFQSLSAFGGPPIKKKEQEERKIPRGTTYIHESRLIVFRGIQTSNYYFPQNEISPYWGASVFPRFVDGLRDFEVGTSGLGILMVDPAQPVITIPGLMHMVGKNEQALRDRFSAIELGRSIARIIALGKDEKYERQTTNLSGIPEIWDRLSLFTAAMMDIPLSILINYSPASLGTPDKDERTQWYNKCRSVRTNELEDPLTTIIRMVMRSVRKRKIPKRWKVGWNDLEHMTTPQFVEAQLGMARVDSMNIKSGMADPDELRKARWRGGYSFHTSINEKKKAPGFLAPLPAGVLPKAMSSEAEIQAIESGAKRPVAGAAPASTAHTVGGYTRRNPTSSGTEPAAKQGGDNVPGQRGDDDGCGQEITFAGFPVVIESPKGSVRTWIDSDGAQGQTKMKYDYGYIPGTLGTDGDSIDVYLGPSEDAKWVYVIRQMSKSSGFVMGDEDKVMLGFDSANHARDAYLRQYDDERFFGGMSQMTVDDFRDKLVLNAGMRVAHAPMDGAEPE